MAYLRMKQPIARGNSRTPAQIRCAYVNTAPVDDAHPEATRARYILRDASKPVVTYTRRRHAVHEG